jgi:hypothetical protein
VSNSLKFSLHNSPLAAVDVDAVVDLFGAITKNYFKIEFIWMNELSLKYIKNFNFKQIYVTLNDLANKIKTNLIQFMSI